MAISLKSRVNKNEIRLVSVRDSAIDWASMAEANQMTIDEVKEEYKRDRKPDLLKFKDGEVPTVFCFSDPRSASEYDKMQNLMVRVSNLNNDGKGAVESNRTIWEELYIGSFDAIWDGTPSPINRDKKGHLADAFLQSLIDAGIYGELAMAIIGIFASSMIGGSVSEDSKS